MGDGPIFTQILCTRIQYNTDITGLARAEWAIDNVVIGVNDSSTPGFQDNFDPINDGIWYMAMNAIPKVTCSSTSIALEFSKNMGM